MLASRLDSPDAPQEPFEEIDLTALVAEECARTCADLNVDGTIVMQGSPRLLRRLIRNLLENARHHGGEATAIDVSLANKDKIITLDICDRGPGLPEAERARIFEPFYRLKGTSESSGGAGLGLSLVRSIARRHGGAVHCDEREGGGACFQVTLPISL